VTVPIESRLVEATRYDEHSDQHIQTYCRRELPVCN